jgi:uncharacterized delta-60 repeat protein
MSPLSAVILLLAAADLSQLDAPPEHTEVLSEDGGTLVFGTFTRYGPEGGEAALFRLMPDGTRDATFGPFECQGVVWQETQVTGLSPAPDGGVFVFGDFTRCEGKLAGQHGRDVSRGFALLNGRGEFLNGIASYCNTTEFLEAAPTGNGALLRGDLAGCAAVVNELKYGDDEKLKPWFAKNLVWVNAAGAINAGAVAGTPSDFTEVFAVKADSSGGIWLGGERPDGGGVVHLGANGALDEATTARVASALPNQNGCNLAVGPTGSVVTLCSHAKEERIYFQKLDARGALDTSFSTHASKVKLFGTRVSALAVQGDGKVLVGGRFDRTPQFKTANLFRLNADGTVDKAFASNVQGALGPKESVRAIAVQRDGRILIGGEFRGFKNSRALNLVRLLPDGTVDVAYAVSLGNGFEHPVSSLLLTQEGKLLVGTQYGKLGTVPLMGIARFRDGVLDLDYTRRVTEHVRKVVEDNEAPQVLFHQNMGSSITIIPRPRHCAENCASESLCSTQTYLELDDKGRIVSEKDKKVEIDCWD